MIRLPFEVCRGAWGLLGLAAPNQLVRAFGAPPGDAPVVAVARLLAARHLVQAVVSGPDPGPQVLAVGIWVDAVHALSLLPLAAVDRARARPALVDATLAGSWAAVGYWQLRHCPPRPEPGWRERTAGRVRRLLPLAPAPRPAG